MEHNIYILGLFFWVKKKTREATPKRWIEFFLDQQQQQQQKVLGRITFHSN